MKSIEARPVHNSSEKEPDPGLFELSLETESGDVEQEFFGNKTIAEMLVRNPAFKSEKANRALRKLKEAWKSAEENIPEELKNELRHERRDASNSQDPVHIGSIIADAPARQPGLASMLPAEDETDADIDITDEDGQEETPLPSDRSSIYRRAMVSGFALAVVLVIIFGLFLFLG